MAFIRKDRAQGFQDFFLIVNYENTAFIHNPAILASSEVLHNP
jgi:hypothetical protein